MERFKRLSVNEVAMTELTNSTFTSRLFAQTKELEDGSEVQIQTSEADEDGDFMFKYSILLSRSNKSKSGFGSKASGMFIDVWGPEGLDGSEVNINPKGCNVETTKTLDLETEKEYTNISLIILNNEVEAIEMVEVHAETSAKIEQPTL